MKKLISIIPMMFLPLISYAQKYHDAQSFGLNGHVKESVVIFSKEDYLGEEPYGYSKQVEFDKDGQLIYFDYAPVREIKRNPDGYLKSFKAKRKHPYEISYRDNHKVSMTKYYILLTRYVYDKNNRLIEIERNDPFEIPGELKWDKQKVITDSYDKRGNFLKYQMTEKGEIIGSGKRVITYWDDLSTSKDNYMLKDLSKISFFNTVKVQKIFNVLIKDESNTVLYKARIVYTAPKGTTNNDVTAVYCVDYDDVNSNVEPPKVDALIYHDLGEENEFLGIDVSNSNKSYEIRIDDEAAQYLLDSYADETKWKFKTRISFKVTKQSKLKEPKTL